MKIKIYCLYEPNTLKIRYIGRTKLSLQDRLYRHIYNAKNFKRDNSNKNGSYKINWINSLLKNGIKPKIRLLTEIEGWENSHIVEKKLIQKYLKSHNLVNGDDRGVGNFSKNPTKESEENRKLKLKKYYSIEENKKNFYNPFYTYTQDGRLHKEFNSVKFAEEELNISSQTISNALNRFDNYNRKVNPINGFYFSKKLYNIHPLSKEKNSYQRNHITVKTIDRISKIETKFLSISSFAKFYQLEHWDIYQYRHKKYTKKMKTLLERIEIIYCPS